MDLDPIRFFKNLGVPVDGKRETGVPMTREEALATANRQPIVITERFLEPRVEYTLDPTKNPKTIDLLYEGKTMIVGIYDLQGDRLRIRADSPPNRPKSFERAGDDDSSVLEVLKRVAKTPPPQGPVLIYEVDPASSPTDLSTAETDKLLKAIDRRLNAGLEKLAQVRKLDDGRIEVALMRDNDKDRQRVERLLAKPGTLEFRILANERDNKELIEQARKEPSKAGVLDASGKRLAWWVPVKEGEEKSFAGSPDIVRRTKNTDHREVMEILVVADPYNVTGAYLTKAAVVADQRGKPCIEFTFNENGGQLFAELTGDHLPDAKTGFHYRLGIILDGELWSAPLIHSVIHNKGQISGSFTDEQASEIADGLNAGSLPARLRLVQKPK